MRPFTVIVHYALPPHAVLLAQPPPRIEGSDSAVSSYRYDRLAPKCQDACDFRRVPRTVRIILVRRRAGSNSLQGYHAFPHVPVRNV